MKLRLKGIVIIGLMLAFMMVNPIETSFSMQPKGERYVPFKESPSTKLESLPIPEYAKLTLNYFCNVGIAAYFDLNKKVPKWFEEDYLKSGIPMIMPVDYVSGKPYHFVKKLDQNDTSGFTYDYKNPQQCQFEFILKNSKTGQLFNHVIFIGQKPRPDKLYVFNECKRDYCINFFMTYAKIYVLKNDGKAPKNLKQMLSGEGKLIEAGWKWSAKPGGNTFFEWGMDTSKCRIYYVAQRVQKKETHVLQIAISPSGALKPDSGSWTFKADEKVPTDVCTKTKFISADGLYAFYKSFGK